MPGDEPDSSTDESAATGSEPTGEEPLLTLPADLRGELKDPLGPIETEAAALLEDVSGPLLTVGDVVTYHVLEADRDPDVALVDERTKRQAVDDEVGTTVTAEIDREVRNPPATITGDLVVALQAGLAADEATTIRVDGEEDLAALPAIVTAPDGASVVYGQPDEGMVHVVVDGDVRADVRALLERFDGDQDAFWELLDG